MNLITEFIENNWIEIVGAVIGLLYLYYEYKANILMWPAGILMSTFYTIVFIRAGFYAFACINIYYILVGFYGWFQWYKDRNKSNEKSNTANDIVHTPTRLYLPIFVALISVFAILVFVLKEFTDSQVVYGDSFVTTLSIVAMIMLARKYVEQWLLVIVLNFASTFIYLFQHLYPTSVMYLVYAVVSIFGYFNWKKIADKRNYK